MATCLSFVAAMLLLVELSNLGYVAAVHSPPDILPLGSLVLREDTKVGTHLYSLNATSPHGYKITFSLVSDHFALYKANNSVCLASPLSYQANRFVQFTVIATDRANSTTRQTFTVTVTSTNLNSPVFHRKTYTTEVDEDLPRNSIIFSIRVDDADYGNSRLVVTCIPNENFTDACNMFGLNETRASNKFWEGQLISQSPLNCETVKDVYQVKLSAFDGTHATIKTVEINIRHPQSPPVFLSLPAVTIRSTAAVGSYLAQVTAADSNSFRNRTIVYDIDTDGGQKFFHVDLWSGVVTLKQTIDVTDVLFINGLVINIEVIAREVIDRRNAVYGSGPKTTSKGTLQITVIDVTTNSPRFDAATYATVVPENIHKDQPLPGLSMLVSTASRDRTGRLNLVISDKAFGEIFYIMPSSGIGVVNATIYVRNNSFLDYEAGARRFDILVTAIYSGSFPDILTSNVTVIIRVANVYDAPPTFDLPVYVVLVSLTTRPGVIIGAIQAHSHESGQVFYSLSGSGSDKLVIGNTTGLLTLATCPTATGNCLGSTAGGFNVTLTATDRADRALQASTVLSIRVNASTLLPPTFTGNVYYYTATIGSQMLHTTAPISASASSLPSSKVIVYQLRPDGYDDLFRINQTTGALSALRPLSVSDVRTKGQIILYVTASAGGATAIAQVTVQVQDAPAPGITFPQNYSASFTANSPVGSTLIRVAARATDLNANIIYGIATVAGGDAGQFGIDPLTGDIKLAKNISFVGKKTYIIVVTASLAHDLAKNASTYVILMRSNIPSPYFQPSVVNATISEDFPVGSQIVKLKAFTADDSILLSYGLAEPISAYDMAGNLVDKTLFNPRSLIALVPSTRAVSVVLSASLSRKLASLIQITVTVEDKSTIPPPASGTATVTIQVKPSSRYAPTFMHAELVSTVDVSQAAGTYVTTLQAYDNDSDTVAYSVYPEDVSNGLVIVDSATGVVTLRQPAVNYQSSQPMTTIVQVKNSANLKSFALAKVYVQSSAHGQLVFTQPYYVAIFRDAVTSLIAVQAKSTYPDGDYLPLQYDILGESRVIVNASTGIVSLAGGISLATSQSPYLLFYVTAFQVPRRKFLTRKSYAVPVYVITSSVKFIRKDLYLTLPSSLPNGTDVAWAVAQSSNYSAVLSYSLAINPYDSYAIDSASGRVTIVKPWPASLVASHDIIARVLDPLGFSDSMTIHVTSAGQNSPPYWLFPSDDGDSVVMLENQPPNTIVTSLIQARDNESLVTYGIVTESGITTHTNEFFIDPNTGQIKTLAVLMAVIRDQYLLNLAATDQINQTTTRFLSIKILRNSGISNPIKFSKADYYFYVPAGTAGVCAMNPKTSSCGRVTITETQSGVVVPTAQYVLAGGSVSCSFTITPNGTIFAMSSSCIRNNSYSLLVLVPGQSGSTANVHIFISGSSYYASLPIESPVGSKILDLNSFVGTPVFYSLGAYITQSDDSASGRAINGSSLLHVDSYTGSVFLITLLPPAWAAGYLRFTVIANDLLSGTIVDNSTVTVWIAGYNNQLQLVINGPPSTTTISSVTSYLHDLLSGDHVFIYSLTDISAAAAIAGTSNRQFEVTLSVVSTSTNMLLTQRQTAKLIKDRLATRGSSVATVFSIRMDTVLQSAYIYITSGLINAAAMPPMLPQAYVIGTSPIAAGSSLYYGLAAAVALLVLLLCLLLPMIIICCCCCPPCCAALGSRSNAGIQHYAIIRRLGGLSAWNDVDGAEALEESEDYNYFGNDAFDEYDDEETRMDYVKTFLKGSSNTSAAAAAASDMENTGIGRHEQTEEVFESTYDQGMGRGIGQALHGAGSGEPDRIDVIVSGLAPGSTTLVSELKKPAATSSAAAGASGRLSASGQESAGSNSQVHYATVQRGGTDGMAGAAASTAFSHTATVRRPNDEAARASRSTDHAYEEEDEEEEETWQKSSGHAAGSAGGRGRLHKTVTETEVIEEQRRSQNGGISSLNRQHDRSRLAEHDGGGSGSTGMAGLGIGTLSAVAAVSTSQPLTVILDAQPVNQGMVAEDARYEIRPDAMSCPLPDMSAMHYGQAAPSAGPAASGRYMVELAGQPLAPHLIPAVDEYEILANQQLAHPQPPGVPRSNPYYR